MVGILFLGIFGALALLVIAPVYEALRDGHRYRKTVAHLETRQRLHNEAKAEERRYLERGEDVPNEVSERISLYRSQYGCTLMLSGIPSEDWKKLKDAYPLDE